MSEAEKIMLECEFADWYSERTGKVADSILSKRVRLSFLEGHLIEIRTNQDLGQFLASVNGQVVGMRPLFNPSRN